MCEAKFTEVTTRLGFMGLEALGHKWPMKLRYAYPAQCVPQSGYIPIRGLKRADMAAS